MRTCTVCRHPDERAINLALITGRAFREIAGQFGISKSALARHRIRCIPKDLVQARESRKVAEADMLLAEVCNLQRRATKILVQAEQAGDLRTALSAIREARGSVELLARLAGELRETTQVNVLVTPEYQHLRGLIIQTLAPYPEARLAVASALDHSDAGS